MATELFSILCVVMCTTNVRQRFNTIHLDNCKYKKMDYFDLKKIKRKSKRTNANVTQTFQKIRQNY